MNKHAAIRGDGHSRHEEWNEIRHRLWLIYCDLKEAESDPDQRAELVQACRELLGKALNDMSRMV